MISTYMPAVIRIINDKLQNVGLFNLLCLFKREKETKRYFNILFLR